MCCVDKGACEGVDVCHLFDAEAYRDSKKGRHHHSYLSGSVLCVGEVGGPARLGDLEVWAVAEVGLRLLSVVVLDAQSLLPSTVVGQERPRGP